MFAHVSQRHHDLCGPKKITFTQSVRCGSTCEQCAYTCQKDALLLHPNSSIITKDTQLTTNDFNYEMLDDSFAEPFKHPSYDDLDIRHKIISPCCGYSTFLVAIK